MAEEPPRRSYTIKYVCIYVFIIAFLLLECLDCDNGGVCPDTNDCPVCHNGGSCQDVIDGYNCQCISGYTGVHCETNIDECQGIECKVSGMTFKFTQSEDII